MPDFNLFQRVGDFFEQRKEFRAAALKALRKREGLPSPVDADGNELETRFDDLGNAHYYSADGKLVDHVLFAGTGKDGKPGSFAQGKRQQPSKTVIDEKGIPRTVPTTDVSAAWGHGGGFEILEVADDGRKLTDELRDLNRDADGMALAERVSHGGKSEPTPEFTLSATDEETVDRELQEYIRRHQP